MAVKAKALKDYQVRLLDAAAEAMERAYNPYSNHFVGAALLTKDGKIITGSNFENVSYGGTICAERSALVHANAVGEREFKAIAIISKVAQAQVPCGICRQSLFEAAQVSNTDIEVIMANSDRSKVIVWKISELLPLPFGPKDLGVDLKKYRKP